MRSSPLDVFLPPATKLQQGYVFTDVCDSVWGGIHGRGVHGGGTGGVHGRGHAWQEERPLQWAVRILVECILVS